MNLAKCLILTVSCLVCPCYAAPKAGPAVNSDLMSYYYQHPAPSRFEELFNNANFNDWKRSGSIAGFFGGLLNRNSTLVDRFVTLGGSTKFNADGRKAATMALWLCATEPCRTALERNPFAADQEFVSDTVRYAPVAFDQFPINTPSDIDMLWGWFAATGDNSPVRRILDYIVSHEKSPGSQRAQEPQRDKATFNAAGWSFVSQASHHTIVSDVLSDCARKEPVCGGMMDIVTKNKESKN